MKRTATKKVIAGKVTITGAGVLSVRVADILETEEGQRQLRGLEKMMKAGLIRRKAVA